jgi:hypothetical protein
MAEPRDRKYDEMRNPDRNLKQGAPMPIRQNNGGEVIMRMKRDAPGERWRDEWLKKTTRKKTKASIVCQS